MTLIDAYFVFTTKLERSLSKISTLRCTIKTVKKVKVILRSSFEHTTEDSRPKCYILIFKVICLLFLDKNIFGDFYHIWASRSSWSYYPDAASNPMEAQLKIWL